MSRTRYSARFLRLLYAVGCRARLGWFAVNREFLLFGLLNAIFCFVACFWIATFLGYSRSTAAMFGGLYVVGFPVDISRQGEKAPRVGRSAAAMPQGGSGDDGDLVHQAA